MSAVGGAHVHDIDRVGEEVVRIGRGREPEIGGGPFASGQVRGRNHLEGGTGRSGRPRVDRSEERRVGKECRSRCEENQKKRRKYKRKSGRDRTNVYVNTKEFVHYD